MPAAHSSADEIPRSARYVSYVDESGHSKDPRRNFVSLAGLLATETAWKRFEAHWVKACHEEGVAEPFHMKDFAANKRQFKGWKEAQRRRLLTKLLLCVRDARAIPIGSVVSVQDFNGLSGDLRRKIRDPYFWAFQSLTFNIAAAVYMADEPGPVKMVYAHHPEYSEGLANAGNLWEALREGNPIVRYFMDSYAVGDPRNVLGLQGADLWAYELGHHFEVIRTNARIMRWPFQQFVDLGLNYKAFSHDFISFHDGSGLNGLGLMSRVQRWKEIQLDRPGFVQTIPHGATELAIALARLKSVARNQPNMPAINLPESETK